MLYEVCEIRNDDIIVMHTQKSVLEIINSGACEMKVQPTIFERTIGLMYWNLIPEAGYMDGYSFMLFYPRCYCQNQTFYIYFQEIEDLEGETPLNKFIWEGEDEPTEVSQLHTIILEQ